MASYEASDIGSGSTASTKEVKVQGWPICSCATHIIITIRSTCSYFHRRTGAAIIAQPDSNQDQMYSQLWWVDNIS